MGYRISIYLFEGNNSTNKESISENPTFKSYKNSKQTRNIKEVFSSVESIYKTLTANLILKSEWLNAFLLRLGTVDNMFCHHFYLTLYWRV
jgi:hypothetical protein